MYVHGITSCLNRVSWPTDFFDARPDAAETEEAINKFISGLESQGQAGFDSGLSVEKTGARKAAAQKERLLRGAETRRCRKTDRA